MKSVRLDGREITPSKIVCVGRNYVAHAEELGNEVPDEMVVFAKPNSAITDELVSFRGEEIHYEGELSFMVLAGRLAAVGFGLDLTKRGLQARLKEKGLPWERAKAFDGAALFSEFIGAENAAAPYSIRLEINGALRQSGDVSLMLFRPEAVLAELAGFMTLNDGDIIMTGTPAGVGVIQAGDVFTADVRVGEQVIVKTDWTAK